VPTTWLWTWCQSESKFPIEPSTIEAVMSKGVRCFFEGMTYITGAPSAFKVEGDHLHKEAFCRFLKACHVKHGMRLNMGAKGFWADTCVEGRDKLLLNGNPHGVYRLEADPENAEQARSG